MRVAILVAAVAISACKGKQQAPAAGSAVAAIGSAVALGSAAAGSAAAPPPPLEALRFDDSSDPTLAIAFDHVMPRLPALSGDGKTIAVLWTDNNGMPQPVEAWYVQLQSVADVSHVERLPLINDDDVTYGDNWLVKPPPAKVLAKIHERAQAIAKTLRAGGYASLVAVDTARPDDDGKPAITKLGTLALTFTLHDADETADRSIDVKLAGAAGKVLQSAHITGLRGEVVPANEGPCEYRPNVADVYRDVAATRLFVRIRFWHNENCDAQPDKLLAWDLPAGAVIDRERAAIGDVVDRQFDTLHATEWSALAIPGALVVGPSGIVDGPRQVGVLVFDRRFITHSDQDVAITVARDGQTAWASLTTKVEMSSDPTEDAYLPWRASDVLVKTAAGWRIAAIAWTAPVDNESANAAAKAGKTAPKPLAGDPGDASLRDAFAKLASAGVDAAARGDLVAIGSGPGERTVGPVFGRAWNAAWKGKVTIVASVARLAPSATTGWVVASVTLHKPGYQLPFLVFAVFDKTAAGEWSLVHIHFAA